LEQQEGKGWRKEEIEETEEIVMDMAERKACKEGGRGLSPANKILHRGISKTSSAAR